MILFLTCHTLFAQDALDAMSSAFEKKLETAADDWLAHRYARALDGFLASRDIIRQYMPSLAEEFEWQSASVLTSYSILLARLVEIDMRRLEGNDQWVASLTDQSHEWADRLQDQTSAWSDLKVQSLHQMKLRNRWLNRITLVIQHTRNGKG